MNIIRGRAAPRNPHLGEARRSLFIRYDGSE